MANDEKIEEMADQCHDYCKDGTSYLPLAVVAGTGVYACRAGHVWRCGWAGQETSINPHILARHHLPAPPTPDWRDLAGGAL